MKKILYSFLALLKLGERKTEINRLLIFLFSFAIATVTTHLVYLADNSITMFLKHVEFLTNVYLVLSAMVFTGITIMMSLTKSESFDEVKIGASGKIGKSPRQMEYGRICSLLIIYLVNIIINVVIVLMAEPTIYLIEWTRIVRRVAFILAGTYYFVGIRSISAIITYSINISSAVNNANGCDGNGEATVARPTKCM